MKKHLIVYRKRKRKILEFYLEEKERERIELLLIGALLQKYFFDCVWVQVVETGILTASEIEAVRRIIVRYIKSQGGKVYLCQSNFIWLTKKPNDVRMGKGKGENEILGLPVKAGSFLFQILFVSEVDLVSLKKEISLKLSLKITFKSFS